MKIDEIHSAKRTSSGFDLMRKKVIEKKDGTKEDGFVTVGHYGSLRGALLGYCRHCMDASETLAEALEINAQIEANIKKFIK